MSIFQPPRFTGVSLVTMPSLKAARATETLIVEQGCAPLESASFWLTIARMRPLLGSMATTVPFMIAQGVDGGFAHHRIFARGVVARSRIAGEGTGGKALVIANSVSCLAARGNHRRVLLPACLGRTEATARLCREAAMRLSVFALSLILRLLRAS